MATPVQTPISENGIIYSKALFSNWFFWRPARILIDCGEGCASQLEDNIFAVERILLTHEHTDHISGLTSFINLRNTTMGATDKDLDIYYPAGSTHIELLRSFIEATQKRLRYVLRWHPIDVNFQLELDKTHYLKAFGTRHSACPSLGYAIVERRQRLAPEYAQLTQEQIQRALALKQIDRTRLNQPYEQVTLAHTGDAYSIDVEAIKGAETLIIDVTFLNDDDIEHASHYSLSQAIRTAQIVGVKNNLVLQHISTRYTGKQIHDAIEVLKRDLPVNISAYLVRPGMPFHIGGQGKNWIFQR